MKDISELFNAGASSFYDTMKRHQDAAGYRIPIYQRKYDWGKEEIVRLLVDCLNGFHRLSEPSSQSFTFLGTLIVVQEQRKATERSFDGVSLAVVDGQQRLTTLVLIACALIEKISSRKEKIIEESPDKYRDWIKEESELLIGNLFECIMGHKSARAKSYFYPRIVREKDDYRAYSFKDATYDSVLASFLKKFACDHIKDNNFKLSNEVLSAKQGMIYENYELIKCKIENISELKEDEDMVYNDLLRDEFKKKGIKSLFEKIDVLGVDLNGRAVNKALDFLCQRENLPFTRLLLFGLYLTKCVVLTCVETKDEAAAFDIFDSLNTTGEPLTALETLKPLVVQFESSGNKRYDGSKSELEFNKIDKYFDDKFSDPGKRQKETKDIVVSFSLYIEGSKKLSGYKKLSRSLSDQRNYLRDTYKEIPDDKKSDFVKSIAELVEFKKNYWHEDGIKGLSQLHTDPGLCKEIQFCMKFIADMKTTLAIPIVARYWSRFQEEGNHKNLLSAIKALTAFIVIRRAATGTTEGIDAVFRSLMHDKPQFSDHPLSRGIKNSHELWDVSEFKKELCKWLARLDEIVVITERKNWINKVIEIPIARTSRPLARFLLFAAAHRSETDPQEAGHWARENFRYDSLKGDDYLNYEKWISKDLGTLEHVAPESRKSGDDWDKEIYSGLDTSKHTLGNLLLLPQKQNSIIQNNCWSKKKIFYQALMAENKGELESRRKEAKSIGFNFTNLTEKLLHKNGRLTFLDPVRNVEDWSAEFIKNRSRNIAGLAWDKIWPWLSDD